MDHRRETWRRCVPLLDRIARHPLLRRHPNSGGTKMQQDIELKSFLDRSNGIYFPAELPTQPSGLGSTYGIRIAGLAESLLAAERTRASYVAQCIHGMRTVSGRSAQRSSSRSLSPWLDDTPRSVDPLTPLLSSRPARRLGRLPWGGGGGGSEWWW